MTTLAPSFLIESSSFLQVTRTCMKAWMIQISARYLHRLRSYRPLSSEKLIYNVVNTLEPSFLIGSSSVLRVTRTTRKPRMSSKFGQIRPWTAELAALDRLKKSSYTYNGRNVVTTQAPSFIIGTFSFLQETSTCIKA